MKKSLSVVLMLLLCFSLSVAAYAQDEIKVVVDGVQLEFDVPPQIINGRTMVPLRAIFEAMGADVLWNGETSTATGTKGDTVVSLTINDQNPTIDSVIVPIDQPGIIVNSRTLAPLRFVAEAFGGTVTWDGVTQTAYIGDAPSATPSSTLTGIDAVVEELNNIYNGAAGVVRFEIRTGPSASITFGPPNSGSDFPNLVKSFVDNVIRIAEKHNVKMSSINISLNRIGGGQSHSYTSIAYGGNNGLKKGSFSDNDNKINISPNAEYDKLPGGGSSSVTTYQSILDTYSTKLKNATPGLIAEFNQKASGNQGNIARLAEISTEITGKLADISVEGVGKMADYMLSINGQYSEYEQWAGKLNNVYMEEAAKITDAYMKASQ